MKLAMLFGSPFARGAGLRYFAKCSSLLFSFEFAEKPVLFRSRQVNKPFFENKTGRKLTAGTLFDINAPVTKITVFETGEGIGERSCETLGEGNGRAVCSCY